MNRCIVNCSMTKKWNLSGPSLCTWSRCGITIYGDSLLAFPRSGCSESILCCVDQPTDSGCSVVAASDYLSGFGLRGYLSTALAISFGLFHLLHSISTGLRGVRSPIRLVQRTVSSVSQTLAAAPSSKINYPSNRLSRFAQFDCNNKRICIRRKVRCSSFSNVEYGS